MKLKVEVEDHDSENSNDFVDDLQTYITQTPASSSSAASSNFVRVNKRTR